MITRKLFVLLFFLIIHILYTKCNNSSSDSTEATDTSVTSFANFKRKLAEVQLGYGYSGGVQTFVVPSGVTSIRILAYGAASGAGGGGSQGLGAMMQATFAVTPGEVYYIYVGGMGAYASVDYNSGGFNGGGYGLYGAGGGGATDVRYPADNIYNRILVAAGGGGPYYTSNGCYCGGGGHGGGVAANGYSGGANSYGGSGGGGASQSSGGTGSTYGVFYSGANANTGAVGGGGGGGWYGGGVGNSGGGGGGGSSYSTGTEIGGGVGYNGGSGILYIYYNPAPTVTPSLPPTTAPSRIPTSQPSRQPSGQPSTQPSNQPSRQPSSQPTKVPVSLPSGQPSVQPSFQPTGYPTTQPSRQPSCQPSRQPSRHPSRQPSSKPSKQPSKQPTNQPSSQPSIQPISIPSRQPSMQPTSGPSKQPSSQPSQQPSLQPSVTPSVQPSIQPSHRPTSQPSRQPSQQPVIAPSRQPSNQPSNQPLCTPTTQPSADPTLQPTTQPSFMPSSQPSISPSGQPTNIPSCQPNAQPTSQPSSLPSSQPSSSPSEQPSCQPMTLPSTQPSGMPTSQPSSCPSSQPSTQPSQDPSSQPTIRPSTQPSVYPSSQPSRLPSCQPSERPTSQPSAEPATQPTNQPSLIPSSQPSVLPSTQPSGTPSVRPSCQPSTQPSTQPSSRPTIEPTTQPSMRPSGRPSLQPSSQPSSEPSVQPSLQPSSRPSHLPTRQPTQLPSCQPSVHPSRQPFATPTLQPSAQPSSHPTHTYRPTLKHMSDRPLSVVQSVSRNTRFKIVLPFLFTSTVIGDGFQDVVLPSVHSNDSSYVVVGSKTLLHKTYLNAAVPVTATAVSYDYSGRSVSNAGDVNGDGIDDLIIGVPFASKCYVLFGTELGFVNMTEGFTITGIDTASLTGWSVSGAGDVNNDTFADVIVGAPYASNAAGIITGSAYVLFGKASKDTSNIDLSKVLASQGYAVHGASFSDCTGLSVSGAGDLNGDGYDDVIIGTLGLGNKYSGAAYVLFGRSTLRSQAVNLDTLNNSNDGFKISGSIFSWLGYSVSVAGDVNGDGLGDVLIGSMLRRNPGESPVTYLIYGNKTLSSFGVERMTAGQGVVITGGGTIVSGIGDLNGDGLGDFMLGIDFLGVGGGYVVQYPNKIPIVPAPSMLPSVSPSWTPTMRPSISPSISPSVVPSQAPTVHPTQPTVVPTIAPTGPTFNPTMEPTQPTSIPTAKPTAPSHAPSVIPTLMPSEEPSEVPSYEPSECPSFIPSFKPSVMATLRPSPAPSVKPTFEPSLPNPTRFPVVRPTVSPSSVRPTHTPAPSRPLVANVTYVTLKIKSGGEYTRTPVNYTNYIVNCTAAVVIVGDGGVALFTVYPNRNTSLVIGNFNVSTDVIDLTAFPLLRSMIDLNITFQRSARRYLRRRLLASRAIILDLGQHQFIMITNKTGDNLAPDNFIFSEFVPTFSPRKAITWTLTVSLEVAGCGLLVLYMIFECYRMWKRYNLTLHSKKAKVADFEQARVKNHTYVSFTEEQLEWFQRVESAAQEELNDRDTDSDESAFSFSIEAKLKWYSKLRYKTLRNDSARIRTASEEKERLTPQNSSSVLLIETETEQQSDETALLDRDVYEISMQRVERASTPLTTESEQPLYTQGILQAQFKQAYVQAAEETTLLQQQLHLIESLPPPLQRKVRAKVALSRLNMTIRAVTSTDTYANKATHQEDANESRALIATTGNDTSHTAQSIPSSVAFINHRQRLCSEEEGDLNSVSSNSHSSDSEDDVECEDRSDSSSDSSDDE